MAAKNTVDGIDSKIYVFLWAYMPNAILKMVSTHNVLLAI